MGEITMLKSYATLNAVHADKVLYKLCKHFALKIPVDFDSVQAHIQFAYGECFIRRAGDELAMTCSSDSAEKLAKVEWVIEDHLGLMVRNAELKLHWQQVETSTQSV